MALFRNIVYVLDDHYTEPPASLLRAITLAENSQATLTILYVLPKLSLSSYSQEIEIDHEEAESLIIEREKVRLQEYVHSLSQNISPTADLRIGKSYIEIVRAVTENSFDLVIKQVDHISWLERLIGSNDMQLLRNCPCPVWLLKDNVNVDYKNIIVAVDFDTEADETLNADLNRKMLGIASALSLADFTALHIVNTYDVPEAGFVSLWVDQPSNTEQDLYESEYQRRSYQMKVLLTNLQQSLGESTYRYLAPKSYVVRGIADHELPKMADDLNADLVIMGTVARTGIPGAIIGNTAESVLSQLQCSVLAIKPEGFVCPIK
ncbi:universal stress protein [Gilvimarinus sp. 1_MG-2023]|uniref:universal stress protein n=1 Tax=Gilvimarinus sp. 1_MG-2023 TaxID=3062638 RepID=UPI0026E35964|nr:universal stress protein [Gilvimarinus sp. 1_MG-2023]MDO6747579.1 universal stress protein [Gilvimarinus sp. 1_MG-2023]